MGQEPSFNKVVDDSEKKKKGKKGSIKLDVKDSSGEKCRVTWFNLPEDHDSYQFIKNELIQSQTCHNSAGLNVIGIVSIKNPQAVERVRKRVESVLRNEPDPHGILLNNMKILYHGTTNEAIKKILRTPSQFLINRVISNGRMLGNGVYFSPDPMKCFRYSGRKKRGDEEVRHVLRCVVFCHGAKYAAPGMKDYPNSVFDEYCIFDTKYILITHLISAKQYRFSRRKKGCTPKGGTPATRFDLTNVLGMNMDHWRGVSNVFSKIIQKHKKEVRDNKTRIRIQEDTIRQQKEELKKLKENQEQKATVLPQIRVPQKNKLEQLSETIVEQKKKMEKLSLTIFKQELDSFGSQGTIRRQKDTIGVQKKELEQKELEIRDFKATIRRQKDTIRQQKEKVFKLGAAKISFETSIQCQEDIIREQKKELRYLFDERRDQRTTMQKLKNTIQQRENELKQQKEEIQRFFARKRILQRNLEPAAMIPLIVFVLGSLVFLVWSFNVFWGILFWIAECMCIWQISEAFYRVGTKKSVGKFFRAKFVNF